MTPETHSWSWKQSGLLAAYIAAAGVLWVFDKQAVMFWFV